MAIPPPAIAGYSGSAPVRMVRGAVGGMRQNGVNQIRPGMQTFANTAAANPYAAVLVRNAPSMAERGGYTTPAQRLNPTGAPQYMNESPRAAQRPPVMSPTAPVSANTSSPANFAGALSAARPATTGAAAMRPSPADVAGGSTFAGASRPSVAASPLVTAGSAKDAATIEAMVKAERAKNGPMSFQDAKALNGLMRRYLGM